MGGFFSMDGMFYKLGSILADMMIVGILWFFCSLPIVTIGATTTSAFYVMTRRVSDKEGYLVRDFFKSFKQNFVQSTIANILIILLYAILAVNIMNINVIGDMKKFILPFQFCFVFELTIITLYIYPLIARFQMNIPTLIKTAFFMANKHIFTSLFGVVASVVIIVFSITYPPVSLIAMGLYAYFFSHFIMRIFKKYRPELDNDELITVSTPSEN